MMVELRVVGLALDPRTKMPIVLLEREGSGEHLPIWIGLVEASAIATELEKIPLQRPMTHDLFMRVLQEVGAAVEKVEIVDLQENTFFAVLHLRRGEQTWALDARPSDSIALALRAGAPIFVAEEVLARARKVEVVTRAEAAERGAEDGEEAAEVEAALGEPVERPPETEGPRPVAPGDTGWDEVLEKLPPDQFGKYKM